MTYGLSIPSEAAISSEPTWTKGPRMTDSLEPLSSDFVKHWQITKATPKVGMQVGQQFMIFEVIEPGRQFFKISAEGACDNIAADWLAADLEFQGGKLVHHFKIAKTYWTVSLEPDGSLQAQGKKGADAEAPGEWVAQEE